MSIESLGTVGKCFHCKKLCNTYDNKHMRYDCCDCEIESERIIPYPAVTSHRKCKKCGQEMRYHGYIEAVYMPVCNWKVE